MAVAAYAACACTHPRYSNMQTTKPMSLVVLNITLLLVSARIDRVMILQS